MLLPNCLYPCINDKIDCLAFRNCKSMKDYGASLTWPEPPRALKETARKFESMFSRWRGYMVIRRVPPEDRDMLKRKLLAWELVGAGAGNGGRQNWGMNRRWYGDYLSQERMPAEYLTTIQDIRTKDGVNNIIFSSKVGYIQAHKLKLILLFSDSKNQSPQANHRQVLSSE